MRAVWSVLLLLPLAGCSEPPEADEVEDAPAAEADPWEGEVSQLILHMDGASTQFDVLCTFGGGVEMRRAGGLVLNGTSHLQAKVAASMTTTGVQLGYVITDRAGYDEVSQDGITWLPPVSGGEESFEIEVPAEGIETADHVVWHFFQRVNLPGEAQQDCYTGIHDGDMLLHVEAVRGE